MESETVTEAANGSSRRLMESETVTEAANGAGDRHGGG